MPERCAWSCCKHTSSHDRDSTVCSTNLTHHSQYLLPPKSVVYTGCVGDDDLAEQLRAANKREGLDEVYLVKKGDKTGACTVILTGHHR